VRHGWSSVESILEESIGKWGRVMTVGNRELCRKHGLLSVVSREGFARRAISIAASQDAWMHPAAAHCPAVGVVAVTNCRRRVHAGRINEQLTSNLILLDVLLGVEMLPAAFRFLAESMSDGSELAANCTK
jgi:hypothetical protein